MNSKKLTEKKTVTKANGQVFAAKQKSGPRTGARSALPTTPVLTPLEPQSRLGAKYSKFE